MKTECLLLTSNTSKKKRRNVWTWTLIIPLDGQGYRLVSICYITRATVSHQQPLPLQTRGTAYLAVFFKHLLYIQLADEKQDRRLLQPITFHFYDRAVCYWFLLFGHAHTLFHYLIDLLSEATISFAYRGETDACVFQIVYSRVYGKNGHFTFLPWCPHYSLKIPPKKRRRSSKTFKPLSHVSTISILQSLAALEREMSYNMAAAVVLNAGSCGLWRFAWSYVLVDRSIVRRPWCPCAS